MQKGETMSGRQIVILKGSPRKKGNSSVLADQVAAGAREVGAVVESFDLHELEIRPCDACDYCQGVGGGQCTIADDMQMLYPRLQAADAIVIASPIYWFTVCAQTKVFMDRWYALGGPEGHAFAGKRFGIVLTYADADPFSSGAINALRTFQDALSYVKASIVGMVYGSAWDAGEIKKNKELMEKAYELGKQLAAD
jgi:multimeric flavodoxin WrbA